VEFYFSLVRYLEVDPVATVRAGIVAGLPRDDDREALATA
jgi:hypothetical protein